MVHRIEGKPAIRQTSSLDVFMIQSVATPPCQNGSGLSYANVLPLGSAQVGAGTQMQ